MKLPWVLSDRQEITFEPLGNDAGFLLNIEGHRVVALKLAANIAREVAGQTSLASGIVARLAKVFRAAEAGQWLIVANLQNGFINDYDKFAALVAQRLTKASGVTVPPSSIVVAGKQVGAETGQLGGAPKVTDAVTAY